MSSDTEGTKDFDGPKKHLDDQKKYFDNSGQFQFKLVPAFVVMWAVVVYLLLDVTDENLLLIDSASLKLPKLNVSLPVTGFVYIAPLLFVILHFYLLHNLKEHCGKLVAWSNCWLETYPAANKEVDMPLQINSFLFDYAWLANDCASTAFAKRLLPGLCWLFYCWLCCVVLIAFFIRFAYLQQYNYILWHLFLIGLDVGVLYLYWPGFTKKSKKYVCCEFFLWGMAILAAVWMLTLFMLIKTDTSPLFLKYMLDREKQLGIRFVPRLSLVGWQSTQIHNFSPDDVNKNFVKPKKDICIAQKTQNLLYLSGRDLAFADFSNAHMFKVNLNCAHLQGANFGNTRLQGSELSFASLQGATLERVNLQDSILYSAKLQGANLHFAELQRANLNSALLFGSQLSEAQLQGADLGGAQLQGANLKNANLKGAFLESASLQGADFSGVNLDVALLIKTQLKGITLSKINPFKFSWIQEPDLEKPYDFTKLKSESWAQTGTVQSQLVHAQNLVNERDIMEMPPSIDREKFTNRWLSSLCKEDNMTYTMLNQLHSLAFPPIATTRIDQYMDKQKKCTNYRNIRK